MASCIVWTEEWMYYGNVKDHVALARLNVDGETRALLEYHGTPQSNFYTIRRYERGQQGQATGRFSLAEAKAEAESIL